MNRERWMEKKIGAWIGKAIGIGVMVVVVGALFVWVTQWLWNWLVPVLFNGPVITFWQALGLLVLSKILFSGIGGKGGHHKHNGWKPFWKEKWNRMSPEERERFKEKMKNKWCGWGPEDTSAKDSGASNV